MAEHVVIKIDIDADTDAIDRVKRKLLGLKAAAAGLDGDMDGLSDSSNKAGVSLDDVGHSAGKTSTSLNNAGNSSNKFSKSQGTLAKHLSKTKRELNWFDKALGKFGKLLQGVMKFSLKALLVNIAAVTAALLSVGGAFAISRMAVKAWHASLTVAAGVGASFVAVLAGVVAGQRQWNAAMLAYKYTTSAGLGAGTAEATAQLRGLTKNIDLAVLGTEALTGAFSAISRNTQVTGAITSAMTAMGDFAAASADPSKSLVAAGDFLGQLVKSGTLTEDIITAAGEVGPEFAKALDDGMKNLNIKTSEQFMAALMGGELSGAVTGQLDNLNNTLFGTAKRNFQLIKEQFADMGQGFLPEFTYAIERMGQIASTALISISASISHFAGGSMIDGFLGGFERLTKWTAKLFNEYLPKTKGMFDRIRDKVNEVKDTLEGWVDALRPLEAGVAVLKEAFGPLLKSFFTEFGGGVKGFSQLLVDYQGKTNTFGKSLERLFKSFGQLSSSLKKMLFELLPTLTKIADVISTIVGGISKAVSIASSFGGIGAVLGAVGMGVGYNQLGKLGQAGKAQMGSSKAQMAQAALNNAKGGGMGQMITASMSVAQMMVTSMTVASMIQASVPLGAAGSAWGPPTGPASPGPIPGGTPAGRFGRFGQFARGAGRGLTRLGGSPIGQMAAIAGGLWGMGKLEENSSQGGNAVGGAATGAGIGTLIAPGVGTVVGAGVGAVGGLVYDEFYGKAARNKESAKKIAEGTTNEAALKASESLGNYDMAGTIKTMTQLANRNDMLKGLYEEFFKDKDELERIGMGMHLMQSGQLNAQEGKALMEAPGTFIKSLEDQEEVLKNQVNPAVKQFSKNMRDLELSTGLSREKLIEAGDALGLDLTAPIENFTELMSQAIGVDLPETIAGLLASKTDLFLNALDSVTQPHIALQAAAEAVDQESEVLRGKVAAGETLTSADLAEFLRTAAAFELNKTYDPLTGQTNGFQAYEELQKKIGVGGQYYEQGNLLQGQESQFTALLAPMMGDLWSEFMVNYGTTAINTANAQSLQAGQGPLVAMPSEQELRQMTPEDARGLEDLSASSFQLNSAATILNGTGPALAAEIRNGFAGLSINVQVLSSGVVQPGPGGKITIPGDANGDGVMDAADTATSRFGATMAKHNSVDSKLAGKRKVTSGMRSDRLGSINSDHVTGGALDITGQNLGAYQQMVRSTGGFAEFHGGSQNRHLHVVPGAGGTDGVGDAPMPVAQMATAPTPTASGAPISLVVNPSPGMDEAALARKMMRMLMEAQRSARERM